MKKMFKIVIFHLCILRQMLLKCITNIYKKHLRNINCPADASSFNSSAARKGPAAIAYKKCAPPDQFVLYRCSAKRLSIL